MLFHLSASPGGSEAAEPHSNKGQAEEPTDEEQEWAVLMNATREMEEGHQARAAQGGTPEVQPVAAAQAGAAAEAPAAVGPAAAAGADQLTAQQRDYIAAQRRRFAEAKQAGEAPPPAVHASPSPPPAPRPASWQPRLPLAPRSVLPPVAEAARAVQQGAKGRAALGLENRRAHGRVSGGSFATDQPVWCHGLQPRVRARELCPLPLIMCWPLRSLGFPVLSPLAPTALPPPCSYHTSTASGKAGGPGRPSTLPLSANRAAGAAAIARAEGLGAWQAANNTPDDSVGIDAQLEASSRHRSKLRFVRRLFPGLSCFLPEEARD